MATSSVLPIRVSRVSIAQHDPAVKIRDSYADLPPERAVARPPTVASLPVSPPPEVTKRLRLLEHPIADHVLAAMRDRNTPPEQFRLHCQRLLLFLLVEATRSMPSESARKASGGAAAGEAAPTEAVVLLSLNRHGLGLTHQMADCIPGAVTGVVSLTDSTAGRPEARLHLVRAPALGESRVILFAPVVSTGLSACLALDLLRRSGAKNVSLISLIMSAKGQSRIQAADKNVQLWAAAVDSEWDAKVGPLPGVGDFSERLYGPKLR